MWVIKERRLEEETRVGSVKQVVLWGDKWREERAVLHNGSSSRLHEGLGLLPAGRDPGRASKSKCSHLVSGARSHARSSG